MDNALHEVIEPPVPTIVATATVAVAVTQLSQVQQPCPVVIEPESHRSLHRVVQLSKTQETLIQALRQWAQDFHCEPILALTRAAGHD
ncbi:hypothetical protein PGN35_017275 [Nodosilinea sp. PGN35]|uniref:hypothetical protein n=1 Tax=Nodosilinea sp. PGN35 TaxID=3020489 RepID=UPI0023B316C9|nr:hypothetical protein [Nodosilinea sp. TSF1-S3]MDF0369591.1 hypothetical protein [Nodosilinea sp. TSF1-S3]